MDQMLQEISEVADQLRAEKITRDEYLARIIEITRHHRPDPKMPEAPGVVTTIFRQIRDRASAVKD